LRSWHKRQGDKTHFVIPNLHESIFPAISVITTGEALEALGIVESFGGIADRGRGALFDRRFERLFK